MKIPAKSIMIILCLLFAGEAYAQTCSVTATSINFGNYDVALLLHNDSTGTITVTCNITPPPDAAIMIGPSPDSGIFNPRRMKHSSISEFLNYNLFTNALRTVIWGNGTQGTSTITLKNVPKNKPQTVTIYGRIPAGQDVSSGQYSDTLVVTIVW